MTTDQTKRGIRKSQVGVVTSTAMQKTVTVAVDAAQDIEVPGPRRKEDLPGRRPRAHSRNASAERPKTLACCGNPG